MSDFDERSDQKLETMKEERKAQRKPQPGGHMRGLYSTEKARDAKGALRKLLSFLGKFKAAIIAALIFAIGATIFNVIGPKVLSEATTVLFNGIVAKVQGTGAIDFESIGHILLVALLLYAISSACMFGQGWLLTYVSQRTCYDMRNAIAEKIDRLPVGYFEKTSVGDTLSRITNDVDTLGQSLNQGISELLRSTVTIVGVIIMMFTINVPMTLVTLLIVPLSLIIIRAIVSRTQRYFRAQQNVLGTIDGQIEETFSGQVVVKAFGREQETIDEFNETNDKLYDAAWKSQFLSGLMMPAMNFVGNMGYVAVAIMGSVFATRGIITVGDIQAFIQYVKNFTQPITSLAQVSNVLQQTAAAAERIYDFLELPEEESEESSVSIDEIGTCVEFDHVRFGYDENVPIIHDFTAKVEEGQTVALVGPTGAGKTTMVKLLMRFYDVQGGAIRIGGHDVRDIARGDERKLFGMVLQDTWLFSDTIRENIRFGDLTATDEEVEEAARRAFAHHFIETLPEGYDTVINEDASNISQGQRQLLTIARAFLANRRMLILDEATSSVDTRTEERIQHAMDDLMKGRTSFVIAHRLSTIRDADLILVIRDGDIVEQGTHDELLALGGFYAELYNSQFDDKVDVPSDR